MNNIFAFWFCAVRASRSITSSSVLDALLIAHTHAHSTPTHTHGPTPLASSRMNLPDMGRTISGCRLHEQLVQTVIPSGGREAWADHLPSLGTRRSAFPASAYPSFLPPCHFLPAGRRTCTFHTCSYPTLTPSWILLDSFIPWHWNAGRYRVVAGCEPHSGRCLQFKQTEQTT